MSLESRQAMTMPCLHDLMHKVLLLSCAAVHSLACQLTIADLGNGQMVQGVMILQDQYCLWSSLSQQDTATFYRLASITLVPVMQGPSIGRRLATATAALRSVVSHANSLCIDIIEVLPAYVCKATHRYCLAAMHTGPSYALCSTPHQY